LVIFDISRLILKLLVFKMSGRLC